jgi:hypothetical protein
MRILLMLAIEPGAEAKAAPEFHGLLDAYYLLSDAGLELVVASPAGGSAWAGSDRDDEAGQGLAERFKSDSRARDILNDLLPLDDVHAADFDAALCLGFGRFTWGAANGGRAGQLIAELLALARPVAVISPRDAFPISDTGEGLLIVGRASRGPGIAARALLGVIGEAGSRK